MLDDSDTIVLVFSVLCSGYVEFWNTEACEKAATLNGKTLLGRPIRIDWTD
jgi:RNA recognition motif-containing protein